MVLFMITNFQKWVCKENVCLFISMVLFYDCKFSKMGIHGNGWGFFFFFLKKLSERAPKHTTGLTPPSFNMK